MSIDALWLKAMVLGAQASTPGSRMRMEMMRCRFPEPDEAEYDEVNTDDEEEE